ncbi:hypothetical protein BGP_2618 [Beggiatoa sp. PS]|nr:hypothetical protein BGP_2618 [Beggiatoa sp. PS]
MVPMQRHWNLFSYSKKNILPPKKINIIVKFDSNNDFSIREKIMNTLRQIHQTTSDTLMIKISEALRHQTIEIIILPVDDHKKNSQSKSSTLPPDFFDQFFGCLPDFPDI